MRKIEGSILAFGVAAVLFIQAAYPQKRLKDSIVFKFNEDIVTYPADFLRLVSFGFGHAAGSLLWLRFLQQTPPRKVEANQVSWIYHDLDTVTELDPGFYPAYEQGGIFLSVITEDKRGAEKIFLKGVRHFPDRWRIRAYLAYHYRWELNEPEKAAEQYLAAKDLPDAPPVLKVYAASAMARRGNAATAIYFLRGVLGNTKDPSARKRIEDKIKAISKEAM